MHIFFAMCMYTYIQQQLVFFQKQYSKQARLQSGLHVVQVQLSVCCVADPDLCLFQALACCSMLLLTIALNTLPRACEELLADLDFLSDLLSQSSTIYLSLPLELP